MKSHTSDQNMVKKISSDIYNLLNIVSKADIEYIHPNNFEHVKKSCKTWDSGVVQGNCLFGAVCLGLMKIASYDLSKIEYITTELRKVIYGYIREKWFYDTIFSDQQWHDIIYITHNLAIPVEEKYEYGEWEEDPVSRLNSFMLEHDTFYASIPELMAFSELMYLNFDVLVCFRIFKHESKERYLRCHSIVPEQHEKCILIDLKSIGKPDTIYAHYKLCESGSIKKFMT